MKTTSNDFWATLAPKLDTLEPDERTAMQLCEEWGVSAAGIKSMLRRLEREGRITSRLVRIITGGIPRETRVYKPAR